MTTGLIGRKLGMTRVFAEDGTAVPVTVIEAGPCRVVQVREGGVQLGWGAQRKQRVTRAELGHAKKAGLDVDAVVETISKGAAQSWQMENRYKTMAAGKYDFGFAVDWMRKDLSICVGEARRNGASLPVTALVDQFYAEIQGMGGRRWDTSSLIARLER